MTYDRDELVRLAAAALTGVLADPSTSERGERYVKAAVQFACATLDEIDRQAPSDVTLSGNHLEKLKCVDAVSDRLHKQFQHMRRETLDLRSVAEAAVDVLFVEGGGDPQATTTSAPVDPGEIVVTGAIEAAFNAELRRLGFTAALRAAIAAWLAENPAAAPAPTAQATPLDGIVPPDGYDLAARDQNGEWRFYAREATAEYRNGVGLWVGANIFRTFNISGHFNGPWDQSLHRHLGDGKWQHVGGSTDD